jgi:hypothetical protein
MMTPWGRSDYKKEYAPGIVCYGTPSHGGFRVDAKLMPDSLRLDDGWYEEDCEWARVAAAWPELFPVAARAQAKDSLRQWNPEAYEKFYVEIVMPGESYIRDQDIFRMENRGRMVTLAASGRDDGMVEVLAGRGGRLESGQYPAEVAKFLVPAGEYDMGKHGFVVDESRYQRVA